MHMHILYSYSSKSPQVILFVVSWKQQEFRKQIKNPKHSFIASWNFQKLLKTLNIIVVFHQIVERWLLICYIDKIVHWIYTVSHFCHNEWLRRIGYRLYMWWLLPIFVFVFLIVFVIHTIQIIFLHRKNKQKNNKPKQIDFWVISVKIQEKCFAMSIIAFVNKKVIEFKAIFVSCQV